MSTGLNGERTWSDGKNGAWGLGALLEGAIFDWRESLMCDGCMDCECGGVIGTTRALLFCLMIENGFPNNSTCLT